jgi:N4-gp56 family major capsid protein
MDAHTWNEIGKTGILANHQLSKKLYKVALGECVVFPFTNDQGIGFKRNAGETVNLMHVNELPDPESAETEEDGQIPTDKLTFGNRALTLKAYGRGVKFTEMAENLSVFKPSEVLKEKLQDQMTRVLDTMAARAFQDSSAVKVVFSPTSLTGGTWATSGTPGAVATAPFTLDHCKLISAYMRDTIHIPFFQKNYYIGLTCNKNIESLTDDRALIQWHQYLSKGDLLFNNEMGMTHKIRWVEVNRAAAFSNVAGTSAVFGEGVVFGKEGVAYLEALAPHLRLNPNFQGNFGTVHAMAWYGIIVFGSIWNLPDDGKAKIIRLDSL